TARKHSLGFRKLPSQTSITGRPQPVLLGIISMLLSDLLFNRVSPLIAREGASMEKMEPIVVGLIAGRHQLPVSEFIFAGEIQDVLDFQSLSKAIDQFLVDRVGVSVVSGCGV